MPVELTEKPDNEGCHRERQSLYRVEIRLDHDPPAAGHGHLQQPETDGDKRRAAGLAGVLRTHRGQITRSTDHLMKQTY